MYIIYMHHDIICVCVCIQTLRMTYRSINLGLPGGQIGETAPNEQKQDLPGVKAAANVVLEGHAHVRCVAGAVDALAADTL